MDSRYFAVFLGFCACTHAGEIPIKPVVVAEEKIADKAKVMPPPEPKAIAPVMTDIEVGEDPDDTDATSRSEIQ